MAFSDLALKAAAEKVATAVHAGLAKLSFFAHNYDELTDKFGSAIAVPTLNLGAAGTFNTYNYGGKVSDGTYNQFGGELVTLDQHFVNTVGITDKEQAETSNTWLPQTASALADSIVRGAVKYTFGLINGTNFTDAATQVDFTSAETIAQLYATVAGADIPVEQAVVALSPTYYAKVLGKLDSSVYGGREAVVGGVIPGLWGFKGVICTSDIPATGDIIGAVIADSAIGVGARYIDPGSDYAEAWKITSEDGLAIGFRRYTDRDNGIDKLAADCLFGAKLIDKTKILRLADGTPDGD